MDRTIYQSERLYVKMDGKYRWVKTGEIFDKMGLDWEWKKRKWVPQEEIEASRGKDISEWPEKEEKEARKMSILGTCLPGCEAYWKELGGTHFYGNAFGWPNYDRVRELGLRVFVCIEGWDDTRVKEVVNQFKNDPVCGGYWNESIGHEPDIVGVSIETRKHFYDLVRSIDNDCQGHPVMEMFDMTHKFDHYPGWEDRFSNNTHDLLLYDCYPQVHRFDADIEMGFGFINEFADTHQAIPQMKAFFDEGEDMPDFLIKQYNAWVEKYKAFDNPYAPYVAVCFYKDETVRDSGDFRRQIKIINENVMKKLDEKEVR